MKLVLGKSVAGVESDTTETRRRTTTSDTPEIAYSKSTVAWVRSATAVAAGTLIGGAANTLLNAVLDRSSDAAMGAATGGGIFAGGSFGL